MSLYSPEIAVSRFALGFATGFLYRWKPKLMIGVGVALGIVVMFIPKESLVAMSEGWLPFLYEMLFIGLGNLAGGFSLEQLQKERLAKERRFMREL